MLTKALTAGYAAARKLDGGVFKIDPPVDMRAGIAREGKSQSSLHLPTGIIIGDQTSLGLPSTCMEPKLHSIQYDPVGKGYWLEISAKDKDGATQTSFVLLSEDKEGADAVLLKLSPANKALYDGYRKAHDSPGIVLQLEKPVTATEIIQANGTAQHTLLLPALKGIGAQAGLGLPYQSTEPKLHSIQYDSVAKGYWLEISAKDRLGATQTCFVLLSEDKEGLDAVLLKLSPANKALYDGYRKAHSSPNIAVPFKKPADASEVIRENGVSQMTLLLPALKGIGVNTGLGLPCPSTEPKLYSVQHDPKHKGYWIQLGAKNIEGEIKFSYVLLSEDPTKEGMEAVLLVFNPEQRQVWELYRNEPKAALPAEIRAIIGTRNCLNRSFPLPNGNSLRYKKSMSLKKDQPLSSFTITQTKDLGGDRFLFFATAKYENGTIQHVRLLISNSGVEVINQSERESAQICKGFALDRFVAHIAAVGKVPDAKTSPAYCGSALTGQVCVPNMQALSTIIHSKWAKDPVEVFRDYILPYGRMMRLHNLPVGCFLIADDTHQEALRDALTAATHELKFNAGITTVHQWAETVSRTSVQVAEELNVLQALADAGLEEDLSSRHYSPTLAPATQVVPLQTNWKERVRSFSEPEAADALFETLEKDLSVHSLYWEEQYHLSLAKHLSLLLEETEAHPQRREIEERVYRFYPELRDYPGAWRALDSDAAAQMPRSASLTLSRFEIAGTLDALKAPKSSPLPDEPKAGAGKVIEIPELREFCHRGSAINRDAIDAFIAEAADLKTRHPNNAFLLGDTCLAALCRILGQDQALWQSSPTLSQIKSNEISPTQIHLTPLMLELRSSRWAIQSLNRISKIY